MRVKLILLIVVAFAVGATTGLVLHIYNNGAIKVRVSGDALIGGPFNMVTHRGKRVSEKDFLGKLMLVFFGFTNCPDVCPASLQVAGEALEKLGPRSDSLQVVFVSIDPEYDTVETLNSYMSNFDPRIIGLTGTADEVRQIAKAYRVYYAKVEDQSLTTGYTMDHSAFSYLMGRSGKFVAYFPYGTRADALVERVEKELNVR